VYENIDRKGEVVWPDLCRGPHLPNTKLIGNGFAITRSSAAYWRGDQANARLQRVYGTARASNDDLQPCQDRVAEARRPRHRQIEVVWQDLCRGPHLPNPKVSGNVFAITRSSAAYWRGDQANASLQRVYGTAWASKDDLKAYQDRVAEAERRDHRKIGAELDL